MYTISSSNIVEDSGADYYQYDNFTRKLECSSFWGGLLFREYPVLEALTIVQVRWVQPVDSRGFCERVLARCLARSDSVKSALHDSLHNSTDLTYLMKRHSTRLYLAGLVITTFH